MGKLYWGVTMIVSELMSNNVVYVQPDTSLADAARTMLAQHVSGLPVVNKKGQLVGILTEGDLLRRMELGTDGGQVSWLKTFLMPESLAKNYTHTHGRQVSEVMTSDPISVTPATQLTEVAEIMQRRRVKRLPVLDGQKLVGVVGRTDLLRALVLKLIATPDAEVTDASIKDYIKTQLDHERWAPKSGIRVKVSGHVVDLEGVIFSDAERQAVKVIAENAPGVTEVKDNLTFVDPGSGMAFGPM